MCYEAKHASSLLQIPEVHDGVVMATDAAHIDGWHGRERNLNITQGTLENMKIPAGKFVIFLEDT